MNDIVLSTIEQHHMIQKDDNVMVCVSGGADSMALLSFFRQHQNYLGFKSLYACHFNHGLRGASGNADEQLVRAYCEQANIELLVGYGHMRKKSLPKGESIESYARILRYDFFEKAAQTRQHTKIAVAHNKNDVAETALFHLARGTGIKGMRGIPPVRDAVIRPFVAVTRIQIEQYCAQNNIDYAVDETNTDSIHARNRIRRHVIPQLEAVNAQAVDHIARFCGQSAEICAFMESVAQNNLLNASTDNGYDIKCLLKDGDFVANYSIKLLIEQCGISPTQTLVHLCMKVLEGTLTEVQLGRNCYLKTDGRFLMIRADAVIQTPQYCAPLVLGDNDFLNGLTIKVQKIEENQMTLFKKSSKNILNNSIDYDKIIGNVVLRNKKEGDVFCSARRGNTKKLKKLFQECGIAPPQRAYVPLLGDDAGVVWVMNEGAAKRVAVTEDTTQVLYITVQPNNI